MDPSRDTSPSLHLRLYIAGNGPNSMLARVNITAICVEQFPNDYELEIVDLLEFPHRALADRVIVTPTLLRLSPQPVRRIIGNLSDVSQVLLALRHD